MDPVWCPHVHRTGPAQESPMFFISYGTRTGPVQDPQRCRTTKICKFPARASYVAIRAPHGLFMGCLRYLNPHGAHKLMTHALKLYGPRTERQHFLQRRTGPVQAPWVDVRFCWKQPGNSLIGTRAPYELFKGCFEQKSYVHSRCPYGAVRISPHRTRPIEF